MSERAADEPQRQSPEVALQSLLTKPRWQTVLIGLAVDLTAPIVLTAVTAHELLYNSSPLSTWLLTIVLIWALVLRRRLPIIVFAVCLAVVLVLCALGIATLAFFAVLVALYSVAAHRKFRYALISAVVLEVGVFVVSQRFAPAGSVDDAVILLSGLALAALFLGTTLRSSRNYLASVEDRAERLELEQEQQAQLAALAERTRIAREMHDIVAHGLSVVITLAEGAAATVDSDPARAKETMRQVAEGGRQSLGEMRKLLEVLRSDSAADRAPQPTVASLDSVVQDVRMTGLRVDLEIDGDPEEASEAVQATLYRIVQEALTNVLKHARRASTVSIELDFGQTARFSIQDDGEPRRRADSKREEPGNGLRGMQERVAIFDGTVEAGPTPVGWLVRGELQLT